jgi:hypothetical protein
MKGPTAMVVQLGNDDTGISGSGSQDEGLAKPQGEASCYTRIIASRYIRGRHKWPSLSLRMEASRLFATVQTSMR